MWSQLPDDLLQVLRLSLIGSKDDLNALGDDEVFDPRSPALRKLVEQVLFSRTFVPTYYGVLGAVIASFAIKHWWERYRRRCRKNEARQWLAPDSPRSNASSETTLLASDAQSLKDVDAEQTPLLAKGGDLRDLSNRKGPSSSMTRRLQGTLMYQPRPISAISGPRNHLPSNATTLLVVFLWAINIFYLLYHVPLTIPMLFAFADRAGLCFVANLPVLYVLAAKTNQPLQFLTGWSYEQLNIFHRRLGEWMTALAALHGVGMLGVWYTLLRPFHFTLLRFLSSRVILLGIFALVAYLAIYLTSISWVRLLCYETFLGLHIVLQSAALALLFFHHHNSRPYVLASLAIWALDRILSRMIISPKKFVATLQIAPDQRTVLVFCDIPIFRSTPLRNISHGWKAGQHVFITVPAISWKHTLQAHPFTIASPAPPSAMKSGSWPLQLTIREQHGFSRELLEFAKLHQHAEVILDGPYGSLDALEAVRTADRACSIAGGSGIAVTNPLCYDIQVRDQENAMISARMVYANGARRGPKDLTYTAPHNTEKVAHLWVRQDPRSDAWLSYHPRVSKVVGQISLELDDSDGQDDEPVMELVTRKYETGGIHSLRPDMGNELRHWAELDIARSQSIVVVVSGPEGLVRDVRNAAATLLRLGYNIDVHIEKFGW